MKALISAAVLLAATLWPVLASKSNVLRDRWFTWAVITALAAIASTFAAVGLAVMMVALALVAVSEGIRLVVANAQTLQQKTLGLLFLVYAGVGLSLLAWQKPELMAQLIFIVALFDIGGWVGGKTLARLAPFAGKLFAKTSPNKTYGGLVMSVVFGALCNLWLEAFTWPQLVTIAAAAVAGDWLESKLKRNLKVKDAAGWLPGFGGLLDRVDSLIPMGFVLPLIGFFG